MTEATLQTQPKPAIAKTPLKLAFIQSFLPSKSHGGVGYFTHYFANALIERGHEVTIFSLHPAPADALYQVKTLALPGPLQASKLTRAYLFSWLVARQDFAQFDLIHAQGDNFLLVPFVRKKPLVRTFSGSALAEARHARKWTTRLMQLSFYPLEWLSAAMSDANVGISDATAHHLPFLKQTIPQGVDLATFTPGQRKAARPTILFVGHGLHDRKRGYLLLDAFQQEILPALPKAELWLVSDDRVEQPNIKCYRNLTQAQLIELYQQAWVFCLPSSYEGFGRPYIEAMACGTPVVATPNSGACEVLQNGRYGLITQPSDLGQTLLDLLQNETQRASLVQAGLRHVQNFSWQRVVQDYEAIYYSLLS